MQVKISAVIITFNEERNIDRCLTSLKGIVDEIVVLDSYSTDRTEDICRQHGVNFIQHAFDGHIQQKNRVITFASHPHILSLDADEALDETLRNEILSVKNNWEGQGYSMNRLTNYCGKWIKHCGWYPDTKLRLADSRVGKWTGTNPHDMYIVEDMKDTKHLKGDLYHYSYYDVQGHIKQVNYFTDILAKAQFKEGKRASILKIAIAPILKFIKDYFIKGGILDGYYGWVICMISSHATFLKYVKIRELSQNEN